MKKRILTLLLALAMLVSITACGSSTPSDTDGPTDTTPPTTEYVDPYPDNLPERNFEGYEFAIWGTQPDIYHLDEESGDIVDDAIYKRQLAVSERFNVKFSVNETPPGVHELHDLVTTSILADDHAFDVAVMHFIRSAPSLIVDGMIMDWNEVPYIDLDQPWWNQTINETAEIMGHQFFIGGSFTLPSPYAMFYNKQFVEDYPEIEDMYTLVTEGRWTLDKMMDYTKLVSKDLNGDSAWKPEDDQFGLSLNNDGAILNFMYGANHMSVVLDEDGYPTPNIVNDKMISLAEKVNKLVWEDNRTFLTEYATQGTIGLGSFEEGRTFIWVGSVGSAAGMRDFDIDFGLIPYPKYDEQQEGYHTHVDSWNGLLCVPINTENAERTGIIMEALAAETYKNVRPAYYDKALGTKYMRDEQSIEMMDIIFDGIIYDFGYIFDNWQQCTWALVILVTFQQSTDVASYFAGIESPVLAHYKQLYEGVAAYGK